MTTRVSGSLSATIASGDALDVRSFDVEEGLSALFTVHLTVASGNADVDFEAVIGQAASFTLSARGKRRTFSGVAARMSQLSVEETGQSLYHLEIAPKLWLLTHRRNHRMFQRLSEPDMVKLLLDEHGVEHEERLTSTYKKRKYRVQYGETDFAFLSRMLEDAGISYFFEEKDGATKVVLTDAPQQAEARRPALRFHDRPSESDTDWATAVRVGRRVQPGRYTMRDVDHRRPPSYNLRGTAAAPDATGVEGRLERFHYVPGAFLFEDERGDDTPHADDRGKFRTDEAAGNTLAERRLASRRGGARPVAFDSNSVDLHAGGVLTIEGHPRGDLGDDKRLLVTRATLRGGSEGEWQVTCDARDAAVAFHPEVQTPRPRVSGVESATVVGPPGEEIHTDELGRVRVHFHWDRESRMNEESSCWIPVSQPWGGAGYGGTNLPRVGQEVIVDFLGGDPDRPIIVGRVYTHLQTTPYRLPANKTQSGWKSNSTGGGGGYNELMFEDKAGSELLRMQAERNMTALVKHDKDETVGRDRTRVVRRHEAVTVGRNQTVDVVENQSVTVGQNLSLTVGQSRTTQVAQNDSTTVGTRFSLTVTPPAEGEGSGGGGAGTTQVIQHDKIVFTTPGGASITLEGDTITLYAATVAVNATHTVHLHGGQQAVLESAERAKVDARSTSILGNNIVINGDLVEINGPGQPAARVGDPASGVVAAGAPSVTVGDGRFETGLGAEVDALVAQSPTLTARLRQLARDGWTIRTGEPGRGSWADRNRREIVLDPQGRDARSMVQVLAHEAGHAGYTPDPYVRPDGLSREEYVRQNVGSALRDEGEATMMNGDVRREILANGGPDIGFAGSQAGRYQQIYERYPDPADRNRARQEIGDIFADNETPSTSAGSTYRQYYARPYEDFWRDNVRR